jgi:hypothetical protein
MLNIFEELIKENKKLLNIKPKVLNSTGYFNNICLAMLIMVAEKIKDYKLKTVATCECMEFYYSFMDEDRETARNANFFRFYTNLLEKVICLNYPRQEQKLKFQNDFRNITLKFDKGITEYLDMSDKEFYTKMKEVQNKLIYS